jgi:L-lactate dehydrogenase complex protein LldF
MGAMTFTLSNPAIYQTGGKVGRWFMRNIPFVVNNGLNPWFKIEKCQSLQRNLLENGI